MRCATAWRAMLEDELGTLDRAVRPALAFHLLRCRACATRARSERELTRDLRGLAVELPFEIDVAAAVRSRLYDLRAPEWNDVPAGQLAWGAAAAAACVLALIAGAWPLRGELWQFARGGGSLLTHLSPVLVTLAKPFFTLLGLPFEIAARMTTALGPLTARLWPIMSIWLALGYLTLTATVVAVVGRDLRTRTVRSRGNP